MSVLPIPVMYSGGHFIPLASHKRYVADTYGEGEIVTLTRVDEESAASRGHYFALIHQAFNNLPEDVSERFANEDHLRKWCLIKAGFRSERTIVAPTEDDARQIAAFVQAMDDYALVVVSDCTVIVWTAETQKLHHMGRERFQASKDGVLRVLSELIGTDVTSLHNAA